MTPKERAEMMAMTASWPKEKREFIRRLLTFAHDYIDSPEPPAARKGLRRREQTAKVVNSAVELAPAHRIAISKGRKGKSPFLDAVRASGYTLRGLAEAVGCLPSLLSMYRSSDDPRPIPRDRAEAIEKLTGWPADAKHWPGGIS